ncbi:NINE protein [Andreprevotia chitinilytica]|uniref:NINE protein n=1 Tax=Andreprevotia chitinilytica TaxID=396808 RepID=UPI000A01A0E1|nr:NINE protein [Andreprevotia chitinilytica]
MAQLIFCKACGKQLHDNNPICPHCGANQKGPRYKSKVAAGLLAILFGGFGVHRFYLGKWWGLFYLLFCWTLIPGLIAFIEGIVFLCADDAAWNDKYNEGISASGDSGPGLMIALIVGGLFIGVFVIGILAAIAVPAYSQYQTRAKLHEVLAYGKQADAAVEAYYLKTKQVPESLEQAGFAVPKPLSVSQISINKNGILTLTLEIVALKGQSLLLIPSVGDDDKVSWKCASDDIAEQFLPMECRSKEPAPPAKNG